MEKIVIVGSGDHAECVIANILEEKSFEIVGLLDTHKKGSVMGFPILGGDQLLSSLSKTGIHYAFPGAILGSKADTGICCRIMEKIKTSGMKIPNLISSKAVVRLNLKMGCGILVQPGAVIDVGVTLGDGVAINPQVLIGHHCSIGNYVVFAGGAVLNARLKIGERAFIGMGAKIFADIGADCKIAPGSVVMEAVPEGHIAFGNPLRVMRRIN